MERDTGVTVINPGSFNKNFVCSGTSSSTPGIWEFRTGHLKPAMESYLRDYALGDQCKRYSTTYVWHDRNDVLAGFVTLCMYTDTKRDKVTNEPITIPMISLDRLARQEGDKYKGVGKCMLYWSINMANHIPQYLGCTGLVLDPANVKLYNYYTQFDFQPVPGDDNMLFYGFENLSPSNNQYLFSK